MKTARHSHVSPFGHVFKQRISLKGIRLVVVGLLAASIPLQAAETAYQYDARGRLIEVTQGTQEHNYVYDDAGNRTQVSCPHVRNTSTARSERDFEQGLFKILTTTMLKNGKLHVSNCFPMRR